MACLPLPLLPLPFSLFIPSFLLAYPLLWTWFQILGVWGVWKPRGLREKWENNALFFLLLKKWLSLSFLGCWPRVWLGGGGVFVLFCFSFVSLVPNFKIALNANQILLPCIAKTMCRKSGFSWPWWMVLAGHLYDFWLPWEANQASQGSLVQS